MTTTDPLSLTAAKRLAAGRLTVIDATNTQPEARKPLIELARRFTAFQSRWCWISLNRFAWSAIAPGRIETSDLTWFATSVLNCAARWATFKKKAFAM